MRTASPFAAPLAASVVTLAGRMAALLAGAVCSILLPLCLDQHDVGAYFLAQSVLAGLATMGQLGLGVSAPAWVSRSLGLGDPSRAVAVMRQSLSAAFVASVVLALIFAMLLPRVAGDPGATPAHAWSLLAPVSPVIAVTLVLSVAMALAAEHQRVIGHIVTANFLPAGPSLATALLLALAWSLTLGLSLRTVLLAGLGGAALAAAIGVVGLARWAAARAVTVPSTDLSDQADRTDRTDQNGLLRHAAPNLVTTMVLFLSSQSDLWIVAALGTPQDLAVYGLATRLNSLLLVPLLVANSVVSPAIGALWARGARRRLQRVLRAAAMAALLATAIGGLVAAAFGRPLVEWVWGPAYLPSFQLLMILVLGTLAQAAVGAAGYVLMMLGRQVQALRIAMAVSAWMWLAGPLAMAQGGPAALALVSALGCLAQCTALAWLARRHFQLNPAAGWDALRRIATARPGRTQPS